jgi:hypothetical protein
VVRTVLADAAKHGLPGEHHFFVTFDTRAEGARLPPRVREKYPEEMTVVLQHQFWDLTVNDQGFEVGLSFGGVAERLFVPFAAIKSFVDPSVQFGLQFEQVAAEETGDESKAAGEKAKPAAPAPVNESARAAPALTVVKQTEESPEPPPDKPGAGGGEVVRLDRFRKK